MLEHNENTDQKPFYQMEEGKLDFELVQYQSQYDPNSDYAVFGCGDKTKGGIQNMQEKMNIADQNE